jgi:hypothetical protein
MIKGNASRRDQYHMNRRHEVLDWFRPSCGVIAMHPILMSYAIEIGFSLSFLDVFDVDLSFLFIVGESFHRV